MNRVLVVLSFALGLTSGCRFDTSGLPVSLDSGIYDSSHDASQEDSKTDSRHDSLPPSDATYEDSIQSDALQQDAGTCVPNPCLNGGTCAIVSGNAVCTCASRYAGALCDQCDYGCDPYPTCKILAPTVTQPLLNCPGPNHDQCAANQTYSVAFYFTNATTFFTNLVLHSGTNSLGTLTPSSGNLPASTTNATTYHSIQWTAGGPGPIDVEIQITVMGPGGPAADSRTIHIIN